MPSFLFYLFSAIMLGFGILVACSIASTACKDEPELIEDRRIRVLTVAREGQVLWLSDGTPIRLAGVQLAETGPAAMSADIAIRAVMTGPFDVTPVVGGAPESWVCAQPIYGIIDLPMGPVGQICVNEFLVLNGHAQFRATDGLSDPEILRLRACEAWAREFGYGIWNDQPETDVLRRVAFMEAMRVELCDFHLLECLEPPGRCHADIPCSWPSPDMQRHVTELRDE